MAGRRAFARIFFCAISAGACMFSTSREVERSNAPPMATRLTRSAFAVCVCRLIVCGAAGLRVLPAPRK